VLVRGIVQELRAELEINGDWETVHELSEAVLAHGSAAARQREALRRNERITDVVDLIIAETAGESNGSSAEPHPPRLLSGYVAPGFDEALLPDGRSRSTHAALLESLSVLSPSELNRRREVLSKAKHAAGLVFRATDAAAPTEFAVDFVPRVLSGEEWSRLQGGTAQRARALDAFLRDIYGDAEIVRDGILPGWLAARSPGHVASARSWPREARRAHVLGFDVVRDADGRWLVLEDNARVPSGLAYAIQNRRLMRQAFPELVEQHALLDPEEAPALLRKTLEEAAPSGASDKPTILLLTEGPSDSAYFEHQMLAEEMGVLLGAPSQLLFDDGRLFFVGERKQRRPVDVLYLRIEDVLSQVGQDGRLLGPQLLQAVNTGKLATANAIGNGVADDKAMYSYVPKFIEYYLGERPLLEQVTTYHCADPEQRRLVHARLHELVLKPVDGYGGFGVLIGPHASEEELAGARSLIDEQPWRWIAQEVVGLSTHPSFDRGKLRPRHVDLRVFVYYGKEVVVVPAALTRVAPAGSLIVNSSRGGGAKDTWLMS
jgi:carboxylate-amine ligase